VKFNISARELEVSTVFHEKQSRNGQRKGIIMIDLELLPCISLKDKKLLPRTNTIATNSVDPFQLNGATLMDKNFPLEAQLWDEANVLSDLIADCEEKLALYRRQFSGIMLYLGIEDFDATTRPALVPMSSSPEMEPTELMLSCPDDVPGGLSRYIYRVLSEAGKPVHINDIEQKVNEISNRVWGKTSVSSRLSVGYKWFRHTGEKGYYELRHQA
jgi:hypothetical protein